MSKDECFDTLATLAFDEPLDVTLENVAKWFQKLRDFGLHMFPGTVVPRLEDGTMSNIEVLEHFEQQYNIDRLHRLNRELDLRWCRSDLTTTASTPFERLKVIYAASDSWFKVDDAKYEFDRLRRWGPTPEIWRGYTPSGARNEVVRFFTQTLCELYSLDDNMTVKEVLEHVEKDLKINNIALQAYDRVCAIHAAMPYAGRTPAPWSASFVLRHRARVSLRQASRRLGRRLMSS